MKKNEHPLISEARVWLLDCFDHVEGAEEVIREMTPAQIVKAVDRYYDGGWETFVHGTYWAYEQWYRREG